jgi:hypothetical protein
MKLKTSDAGRWTTVVVFAIAMAWVESAVVFYLRSMIDRIDPHQPNPLPVVGSFGPVEMVRELATLVMLFAVGTLAGRNWRAARLRRRRVRRLGHFLLRVPENENLVASIERKRYSRGRRQVFMQAQSAKLRRRELSVLLRGEAESLQSWSAQWNAQRFVSQIGVIVVGAGLFGAAVGWWRDPLQALYTAIKFPLIILLTAAGNAMLNAMLAPLLGLNIPFRQSFLAILMSFTISGAIFGSFAPLVAFVIWNSPPLSPNWWESAGPYSFILLMFVCVTAFAGIVANLRLLQLLRQLGGGRSVAVRVLCAWLGGNLFFGSQLSWILRPFIGSPGLPVQFLRATAFKGNFYEAVFHTAVRIFTF